jgi:hypothetical protein
MSDPAPRGNSRNGMFGALSALGQSLIAALPPVFLMLLLINLVFLAMVMWFVDKNSEQRVAIVRDIVDSCLTHETHQR